MPHGVGTAGGGSRLSSWRKQSTLVALFGNRTETPSWPLKLLLVAGPTTSPCAPCTSQLLLLILKLGPVKYSCMPTAHPAGIGGGGGGS